MQISYFHYWGRLDRMVAHPTVLQRVDKSIRTIPIFSVYFTQNYIYFSQNIILK
jgi:hypothetical protein